MGCHSGTPILRGLILGPSGTMANMGEKGVFTGGKSWSGTRVGLRGLTGVDPGGQKVSELGSQGVKRGTPFWHHDAHTCIMSITWMCHEHPWIHPGSGP